MIQRSLVVFALLLSASLSTRAQGTNRLPGAEPIRIGPDCSFGKDYGKTERAWAEQHLLKPAMELWKGQPWADEAEAFCREALDAEFSWEWRHGLSIGDLADQARKLTTTRCDDVLAYYLIHRAIYESTQDWRQAEHALDVAIAVAGQRRTPEALVCMVMDARRAVAEVRGADLVLWESELSNAIVRAMGDGSYDDAAASVAVRQQHAFTEALKHYDGAYLERLSKAVEASTLPEWARLAMLGGIETQWAWLERGDGWAADVPSESWRGFAEHLDKARGSLEKSWALQPGRPEAAATMISVSTGSCEDIAEKRKWFDRAVAAEFDYQPAYDALVWAYRPRWGGSAELLLQFGAACAETKRFDTWVPCFVWQACNNVGDDLKDKRAPFLDPVVKPEVSAAAEGFLNSNALPPGRRHKMLSRAAVAAWMARDEELAAKVLKEDGPKLEKWTAQGLLTRGFHEEEIRLRVKAATGGLGAEAAKAEKAAADGDEAEYRNLVEGTDMSRLPGEARSFMEQERDALHMAGRLSAGDWVPVTFRQGLTHCVITGGQWAADGKGGVIAEGTDDKYVELLFGVPVEGEVEVRGELAFEIPAEAVVTGCCGFGPLVGWAAPTESNAVTAPLRGLFLHTAPSQEQAVVIGRSFSTGSARIDLESAARYTFLLSRVQGTASLTVNGRPVVQQMNVADMGSGEQAGFPGLTTMQIPRGSRVHFWNIEVRGKPARQPVVQQERGMRRPVPGLTPAERAILAPLPLRAVKVSRT